TATGAPRTSVTADVVVACDGVNSAVRRQFYPGEELCFGGINTWRGVTRMKPYLTGRSYVRVGSIQNGNLVIYPIVDDVDSQGQQLINWTVQVAQPGYDKNDWNKPGRLEDFLPIFASWTFDWLDVPELLRRSDVIFEYPMVDRDPIDRWTFGRVTLLGDAAHPMYPRGSNGAAQAILDARALADRLAAEGDPVAALQAYEAARSQPPLRPTSVSAGRGGRAWCAPIASIRPTIQPAAWRSWWATFPSTTSIATSPAPSSSSSRRTTSASPASRATTWRDRDQPRSTSVTPSFSTSWIRCGSCRIFRSISGSPSTTTRSARLPFSTVPISRSRPRHAAARLVADWIACIGVSPAATRCASSAAFGGWPWPPAS